MVSECNEHTGVRIMRETDVQQESRLKDQERSGKDVTTEKNGRMPKVPPVAPDNRNAEPGIVVIADDHPDPNVSQVGSNTSGGVSTTEHVRSNEDANQQKAEPTSIYGNAASGKDGQLEVGAHKVCVFKIRKIPKMIPPPNMKNINWGVHGR